MPKPQRVDLDRRRLLSIQNPKVLTPIREGNKSICADLGQRGHLSLKGPTSVGKGFQAGGNAPHTFNTNAPGLRTMEIPHFNRPSLMAQYRTSQGPLALRTLRQRRQNSRFGQRSKSFDKLPAPSTNQERMSRSLMAGPFYIKENIPSDKCHATRYD